MIDNLITEDVTIIVPTKNRPNFLYRLLNYYAIAGFKGDILIGDASNDNFLRDNVQIISDFRSKISVKHFINNIGVNGTIEILAEKIETTYCLQCNDDDFVVPNGIAKSLIFLKENPEYSAVHGKGSIISLKTDDCFGNIASLYSYSQSIVDEETGAERLKSYLLSRHALLFSLHRTDTWKKMFQGFKDFEWSNSQQITIDELLSSGISAILGKIKEVDGLYLVRQSHPNQLGGIDRLSPYELVMLKDWSIAINDMSNRFIEEIMSEDQIEYEEAEASVNEILLCYLNNSFRAHQKNIERKDVSLELLPLIIKVIKKYMPFSVKYLRMFFRSGNQIHQDILKDRSSIYYNDMKLIQLVCIEKYKDD